VRVGETKKPQIIRENKEKKTLNNKLGYIVFFCKLEGFRV
jgi:hypothetical protein